MIYNTVIDFKKKKNIECSGAIRKIECIIGGSKINRGNDCIFKSYVGNKEPFKLSKTLIEIFLIYNSFNSAIKPKLIMSCVVLEEKDKRINKT